MNDSSLITVRGNYYNHNSLDGLTKQLSAQYINQQNLSYFDRHFNSLLKCNIEVYRTDWDRANTLAVLYVLYTEEYFLFPPLFFCLLCSPVLFSICQALKLLPKLQSLTHHCCLAYRHPPTHTRTHTFSLLLSCSISSPSLAQCGWLDTLC